MRTWRKPSFVSRFAAVTLTLVAAACSPAGAPETTAPGTTAAAAATPPSDIVDRLVVIDGTGNVVTMDRAGNEMDALTEDAGDGTSYFQPSWSPEAGSIGVSRLSPEGFSLVAFDLAAGTKSELATESNAFYVHWSPGGDRLAYLSTGAEGLGLSIAEFGAAPSTTPVDRGEPFYFTWSPDGGRMATLIGEQRLEVRDTAADSPPRSLAEPGSFQNPAWTAAGIFYSRRSAGLDELVVGGPDGAATVLARSPAGALFTAPASGDRVAVQALGEIDGVSAAFQEAPLLPLNRLVIIETATGELTQITDTQVVAFFWDPVGEKLLILDGSDGDAVHTLRWSIWSDGELRRLGDFVPALGFLRGYLPFFGQYALSTTMWSPDGTAFAFAGVVDSVAGIYVQDVAGGDPVKVSDGSWVMWSPR